ncbi:anthranilate phosphoribosyltransferase family protein [Prochlorococcus sp. MIT 1307]|uniref:anthranilate phosphoribosyltransferase family protein n=1 Tax=Prochlorococcus sp. MIT 1307 TaxID=3096219 RepID=UPI002A74F439|nr:anthranilate phosphoribosyltransferase family protein [Prochlorococcus sp. MIT 1307]
MFERKEEFKTFLRKIGSGEHTSRGLSREESAEALKIILQGQATPAQIGAFMIAHRIRRPEAQELAGMIDAYSELGPKLTSKEKQTRPICFGMPFDGRNRTVPIYPLTTLVLLSAKQPVVLQGGKRMPIKFGLTTAELFEVLGLQLTGLSIQELQTCFDENGLALIHQPDHFPLADSLIDYREELGKRPPLASMELIWTAHKGEHLLVSGFVHPPTEARAYKALALIGEKDLISIKGLEGGIDLPISRACITGRITHNQFKRTILHANDHDCSGQDIEWSNLDEWRKLAIQALENKGPFQTAVHWNAGVYLWLAGQAKSLEAGLNKADIIMRKGLAKQTLEELISWRKKINVLRKAEK